MSPLNPLSVAPWHLPLQAPLARAWQVWTNDPVASRAMMLRQHGVATHAFKRAMSRSFSVAPGKTMVKSLNFVQKSSADGIVRSSGWVGSGGCHTQPAPPQVSDTVSAAHVSVDGYVASQPPPAALSVQVAAEPALGAHDAPSPLFSRQDCVAQEAVGRGSGV